MEPSNRGGSSQTMIGDSNEIIHRLENEFQRTIFRIISLMITWFVGIFSISILIDIQPMINQIGVPGAILFGLIFPILLIVAWGAADHQRRTETDDDYHDHIEDENQLSIIEQIIENVPSDPLAKEIGETGGALYATRGKDPAGVAIGGGADTFDSNMPLIDGMELRSEHEGLEAELQRSTMIRVEADEKVAANAQQSWENAEKNDQELIEAGVERLGDLVATGHFGGPVLSDVDETHESP